MSKRSRKKGGTSPSWDSSAVADLADRWFALLRQMSKEAHLDFQSWEDTDAVAERFAEEQGVTLLGCGNFRCGFAWSPDVVVKLPVGEEVKYMNVAEAENYEAFRRAGIDELLAPVLELGPGGRYLVMQAVSIVPTPSFVLEHALLDELFSLLGLFDIHDENVGRIDDGRLVVFDYGEDYVQLKPDRVRMAKQFLRDSVSRKKFEHKRSSAR